MENLSFIMRNIVLFSFQTLILKYNFTKLHVKTSTILKTSNQMIFPLFQRFLSVFPNVFTYTFLTI